MSECRKEISLADLAKIEEVKRALRESEDSEDKLILKSTEDYERRLGMTPDQIVLDIARDNSPYKDSNMQQRFSAIKKIRAIRGSIYIEVDEHDALKAARLQALRMLGPLATEQEINTYIAEHMTRSRLLSVPKFIKNLKLLAYMVRKAPQLFGEGTGGGTIKDILEDARGAVKEALAYLKKHQDTMPPGLYRLLTNGNMDVPNKAEFAKYLGDDWEKELIDKERARIGENLLLDKNYRN